MLKSTSNALLSGKARSCAQQDSTCCPCFYTEKRLETPTAQDQQCCLWCGKACALLCSPGGSKNLHSMKEDIEEKDNAVKWSSQVTHLDFFSLKLFDQMTPIRAWNQFLAPIYFVRRSVHGVKKDSVYRTNTTLTLRYLGQGTLVDLRLSNGCHYFWYSFLSKESCELSGGDDFPWPSVGQEI